MREESPWDIGVWEIRASQRRVGSCHSFSERVGGSDVDNSTRETRNRQTVDLDDLRSRSEMVPNQQGVRTPAGSDVRHSVFLLRPYTGAWQAPQRGGGRM